MSISIILKKALTRSFVIFSSIILIYAAIVAVFFGGVGMNPISVLLFYPFSFAVALANYIAKYSSLGNGAKRVLHFVILTASLVFFVFLPHGGAVSSKNAFILFVIYCVIYWLVALSAALINGKKKQRDEKNSDYKKVY